MRAKNTGDFASHEIPLIRVPLFVAVDEEGVAAIGKLNGLKVPPLTGNTYGGVMELWNDDGVFYGLLVYIKAGAHKTKSGMVSTIVHECVHLKQGAFRYIQESEPSKEFEAYTVETIFDLVCAAITELIDEESETACGAEERDDVR